MFPEAPPGAHRRWRRAKAVAALSVATLGISSVAVIPASAQQPIGLAPVPITFHLRDDNGKWFDSGLNLFGDQSLAVAVMPRLGTLGGLTTGGELSSLLNSDLVGAVGNLTGNLLGQLPLLGSLGGELGKALNLDSTLASVKAIGTANRQAAPAAAKAENLLGKFAQQLGSMRADQPFNLNSLPVGVDLQGALNDLAKFAVKGAPVTVNFVVDPKESTGIRNPMGLIAPEGAEGFPYENPAGAFFGQRSIQLTEPGLYAFTDMVTPYMLGAVVVDDPLTIGLDFGKASMVNARNLVVPTNSDIINRLVNTFFNITNPNNWQQYKADSENSFNAIQPPVPILQYDAAGNPVLIPNLDAYFDKKFSYPRTLSKGNQLPEVPGVGEVWIDTEVEEWAGKKAVGSATKVDVTNWTVDRKIGAPSINMNNPHNMWTDKDYKYLYQTEWFADKVDVFDRETGEFVRSTQVGHNPAHVMTAPGSDNLIIGINAGNEVVELAPGGTNVLRKITVSPTGEVRHPHAHWTSSDGKTVVTPNVMTNNASVIDMPTGTIRTEKTGQFPIATSMTPDSSTFYTADFLGQTLTCVSLAQDACADNGQMAHSKTIDLWANYSPQDGPKSGTPFGGLTIQLPVTPDGNAMLAANVLSQTVTVIDPRTNKIVKDLPCSAGCHGINFGAKKGGGYYGYVSNKFANVMQIIDVDPNGDGALDDAKIAGQLTLDATSKTKMDGSISGKSGYGGQGVLAIPLVYNGWAQQNQGSWRSQLTCQQLNPIDKSTC
ncbi:copper oxidase [Actinokineospora sp. PR83]|uniref:YncE family protein n=1 Tax=Actinokineospora sp. PR83 TaxID=2884908 RepID=UPI001F41657B|nr:copper oxidase [Actinokineospora sp. PR83]MCG8914945.1 copper oxidase [Actinokineospora sp. PR83]